MSDSVASEMIDTRKWYQKIITVRQADEWNTKRVMIDLPFITISTMDTFCFMIDLDIDLDGIIFAVSIPYLRVWIGKKSWHKYGRILNRKTLRELRSYK